jgi:arsenate reductase
MTVTIYHNPNCGTSRNTLALIRNAGIEPEIVHYLVTPPSRDIVVQLLRSCGMTAGELIRAKEELYKTLHLQNASEDQLIDAMIAHPVLINRPIVLTPRGGLLCRPSEKVLDLLTEPQRGYFAKEDGETVIDASGKRVK